MSAAADLHPRITEALTALAALGLPDAQHNERSALCLLALLDLSPARDWSDAATPLVGITPMMVCQAELSAGSDAMVHRASRGEFAL